MPAIIVAIMVLVCLYLMLAFWFPWLFVKVSSVAIGKSAKFSEEEIWKIRKYHYVATGLLVGTSIAIKGSTGIFSFIFNLIIGAAIWPLGVALELSGAFKEDEGSTVIILGALFFGFVIAQIIAIKMVLLRAHDATNFDDE